MSMIRLKSAAEVVNALGGVPGVVAITGCRAKSVSDYIARGKFPAKYYVAMSSALAISRHNAPPSLWQQVEINPKSRRLRSRSTDHATQSV